MKRYLLLMPVILATTAAIADTEAFTPSRRADAQAQAAALLSGPHASGANADRMRSPSPASATADAQAQAAALLSGRTVGNQVKADSSVVEPSGGRVAMDAQAHARALLSGSQASTDSQVQTERTQGSARPRRAL
jgi:hypothetical protein